RAQGHRWNRVGACRRRASGAANRDSVRGQHHRTGTARPCAPLIRRFAALEAREVSPDRSFGQRLKANRLAPFPGRRLWSKQSANYFARSNVIEETQPTFPSSSFTSHIRPFLLPVGKRVAPISSGRTSVLDVEGC